MRKITHIIIHCSDSIFGDVETINKWHRANGWIEIGYHFVIINGRRSLREENELYDGLVEDGRKINLSGAHARGFNSNSIGICLIGRKQFTKSQLYSLLFLLKELMQTYNIPPQNILGHYEIPSANGKTCPNFNMEIIRKILKQNESDPTKFPFNEKDFNFV